jgi:aspartyl-tRNA(Asn)/glutamyl-tRNA(Gln) amidotransferase subunit A
VRTLVRRDFEHVFGQVDLVASPTSPTVAFRAGSRTADPLAMYMSDICTIPVNLAGLPAISIPCGLSEGLPVGFQLIGPAFSENRILRAAHALEGAIGFGEVPAFRREGAA